MKQRRQTELRARRCIKRRVQRWWSLVLNEVTCWHCNTFFWCWFSLLTDIVSWLCYFTPPPSGAAFSISSSPPLLSSAPPLPSLNPWEGRTNERLGKSKKQLNFLLFHSNCCSSNSAFQYIWLCSSSPPLPPPPPLICPAAIWQILSL